MTRSIATTDALNHENLRAALTKLQVTLGNVCFTDAGIAIATTASKVKTAAIASIVVDGVLVEKAATDNFWTLAGTITDGNTNVFLLSIDSSGAAVATMGTEGATLGAVVITPPSTASAVVGYLIVATSGADFVGGTTLLSAAEVTDTYVDVRGPFNYGEQSL